VIRELAGRVILVALTFFLCYVINFFLIFSGNSNIYGEYTGFAVTVLAFIIAVAIMFVGRKK